MYRRDLAEFANDNAKLMSASNAQIKTETRRRQALHQQCATERYYEDKVKAEQHERRAMQRDIAQSEGLIRELNSEAVENERRAREIQRICEESPELQELQRQLNLAYLQRDRSAQYQEKLMLEQRERERVRAIEDQMEHDRVMHILHEEDKRAVKHAHQSAQKAVLDQQLIEREEQERERIRQREFERQMVEDIVAKVNREDEEEIARRRAAQEEAARIMRQNALEREEELRNRRMKEKAEQEAIAKYNRDMDARNMGVAAKKQAKKEEEDRIFKRIVEETERKRSADEEFRNLRDMLWEEELEAKRTREAAERKQKQISMKREMMDANADMMKYKEQLRGREREEELRMLAIMKLKFAEDDAKEREEEAQRERARQQHRELIERQKDDKRRLVDAERSREDAVEEERRKKEEFKKRVVQEARQRLLEQHAAVLGAYMPGAVFNSQEELRAYKQTSR